MIIDEPGHYYHVLDYDPLGVEPAKLGARLDFFKKIGPKFPGNIGSESWGTNCQEVLRVLIDRVEYLNEQQPCFESRQILFNLREALYQFESRAARVKDQNLAFWELTKTLPPGLRGIESLPHCNICGHIYPHSHTEPKP